MTIAAGCMDDFDPDSLSVEAALRRIETSVHPLTDVERVPLTGALGRILAEDIRSPVDIPPHANSAMDGYALRGSDVALAGSSRLRVIGTAWAGTPFSGTVQPGECVRIMTGAILPAGADTVVMQEHAERNGEQVSFAGLVKPGQHVRYAGEDIAKGQIVLTAGKRLMPAELGVLASLGIAEPGLIRRARVAFFTTGDELRALGEPLNIGQIHDSNRYTLGAMLERLSIETIDLGIVRDRREDIANAFTKAAACSDAIVTSGGVSVGEADLVREILSELGEVNFWKIAMKPGRPLAFGKVKNTLFFGLPGNPVSVMTTFYQFVQPALQRLMGQVRSPGLLLKVPCLSSLKKAAGRMEFQRGILGIDADGGVTVRSTGEQGSGILSSMSKANCFIVLPVESRGSDAGSLVDVQLFEGIV